MVAAIRIFFAGIIKLYIILFGYAMLGCDEILCERIWDMMFSEAAICGSAGKSNRRAAGIPGIMNAITMCRNGSARDVSELDMSPNLLIGHLLTIGWAGRMEFVGRIRVAYSQWRATSGG